MTVELARRLAELAKRTEDAPALEQVRAGVLVELRQLHRRCGDVSGFDARRDDAEAEVREGEVAEEVPERAVLEPAFVRARRVLERLHAVEDEQRPLRAHQLNETRCFVERR